MRKGVGALARIGMHWQFRIDVEGKGYERRGRNGLLGRGKVRSRRNQIPVQLSKIVVDKT